MEPSSERLLSVGVVIFTTGITSLVAGGPHNNHAYQLGGFIYKPNSHAIMMLYFGSLFATRWHKSLSWYLTKGY